MSWYVEIVALAEGHEVVKTIGPYGSRHLRDKAFGNLTQKVDFDRFFLRQVERDAPRVVVDPDFAGHGKFSSNVDEWLYGKALEGWGTESFGEADHGGHCELMEFNPDDPFVVVGPNNNVSKYQAAILVTDSKGFVHVSLYEDLKEARGYWEEARKESEQDDE
jgi:hypothetical protein